MYLSLPISLSLSFCWSGRVFSSLWSNVSKVKSLKDCSLKVFFKCICHCHCLCICICLRRCLFCCSGHVFSSLWSNISKVKSIKSIKRLLFEGVVVIVIVFVFVFVFVVVFLLFRSCFLITEQMFQRSKVSKIALWWFSKCICHCLCLCLFVFQLMFSHYPHQFCGYLSNFATSF